MEIKCSTSNDEPETKKSKLEKQVVNNKCDSLDEQLKFGYANVVKAVCIANNFPNADDRSYYTTYQEFNKVVNTQSERILELMSSVLKFDNVRSYIKQRTNDQKLELIQHCNDVVLERINSNLDELSGANKNPKTVIIESELKTNHFVPKFSGSWNVNKRTDVADKETITARLISAKNIARSQLKFKIPVDNSNIRPFVPKIKTKPNSLKPLAVLPEYDDLGNIVNYLHPYEFELMRFEVPEEQFNTKSPVMPPKLNETEFAYVDTVEKLQTALEELRKYKAIAVDVEHHSYRSFLGFTCLVQMSTVDKDYIFDAVELREDMHILNEVLTDSKIVKIFHGADLDVEWLQRDLSLYVVNMFDTHHAAKQLNFPRLSLAFLLKHYCDIAADKTFQLADWRMRPLPEVLINYARQDTHYLIYMYERITNDLLDLANQNTNILRSIYQSSTELCKKRYVKPLFTKDTHMEFYRKSKRVFDNRQMSALHDLFEWRDTMARKEDESYNYILPNHMLLRIAESLPREMQGILACCNPIPPLVRQCLHALHAIIFKARAQPLVKPILEVDEFSRIAIKNTNEYDNILYCPHDLTHTEDFRNDLPTLLNLNNLAEFTKEETPMQNNMLLKKPALSVFDKTNSNQPNDVAQQTVTVNENLFKTPYERYVAMIPIIEKEKLQEAERLAAKNMHENPIPEPTPEIKAETTEEPKELLNESVREYLKRKRAESNKKPASASNDKTNSKRLKTEQSSSLSKEKEVNSNNSVITIDDDSETEVNAAPQPPPEMPGTSNSQQKSTVASTLSAIGRNLKQKFKNRKKYLSQNKSAQSSNKPIDTNFDYKNIDYKKFQGGSKRAKGIELKPQFHGKNNTNKAKNKKFNKLFTFSNVKANNKKL